MASFIAKYLKTKISKVPKRLSALDPCGPGFHFNPKVGVPNFFDTQLSADDADFVDVIHANKNFLGTLYSVGTVDFWPNGGDDQPGCPEMDISSSDMSNRFSKIPS